MPATSMFKDHADTYATWSVKNPVNVFYDRPTILRLVGDIARKRVLELGCAAGVFTSQLVERGGDVLAVDVEPRLVEFARSRLGSKARFEVADLETPPNFGPAGSVDVVVASLVLHYIKDWTPLLDELHRCLTPGGALVFSLHHPINGWLLSERTDYHRVELITEQWDWGGVSVTAQSYRRPLSAVFGALRRAGFSIDVVEEPQIGSTPEMESNAEMDPELLRTLNTQPFFLFVRAVRE
ncbi:Malonyl-[acyl-carrier protein] O-methyltransferase [Mycobacterium talmoniae]|uniref:Malonyl-[acyl-carrier protein] O-methyltransferase n=1 Tax=Mycobacterium talmoniae TaxID=1858794 RepID=A0A2S8BF52_9MYCO|nr:Malonyl-[acyl-carrier protein] O-methyltransferase [Mycobacterium talmoniae]